ncbi:unnamed protein product [Heligmosomoides polygyrus]|uniref:Uncharacterized protein n=1 Tax=Heligmosomoides polygyrus TaxID=6339 RepID=A0A183FXY6_HELPZ|nr:unnamed protein product [Heligmosomoides polygyrus]
MTCLGLRRRAKDVAQCVWGSGDVPKTLSAKGGSLMGTSTMILQHRAKRASARHAERRDGAGYCLNTTSPTGKHSSGKSRRLECMLLVLKANLNKNVARECKAWSAAELHRYSFDEAAAEELYDSSFDDELQWTSSRSDEERAAPALVENVDSMLPFMEVSHLEDMKNKQQ